MIMKKYLSIGLAAAALGAAGWLLLPANKAGAAEITVYKTPQCGCCKGWVAHLRDKGFAVDVIEREDLDPIKRRMGVPENLGSCHTATVAGYVIEGHVPAKDIRRLLAEKPAARGLAAPGMPVGAPGMEQDNQHDPYDVIMFSDNGKGEVFARY